MPVLAIAQGVADSGTVGRWIGVRWLVSYDT